VPKNCNIVWPNISNYKVKEDKHTHNPTHNPTNGLLIKDIIRRSSEIRDQVMVFKLPRIIIDSDKLLTDFAETIYLLNSCGAKIFIIHDHSDLVLSTLKLFGFNGSYLNNPSGLDSRTSNIVEMVLSGYINKRIVSKLCSVGCYAIGISCKDANLIQAKKSKLSHRRATNHDVIDIEFVSEPVMINPEILLNFEDNNIISVISPIASDDKENTHLLDVNLTTAIISSTLSADHLIFLNEEKAWKGKNFKAQDSAILYEMLETGDFKEIGLLEAAISAIENSTDCVHFVNGSSPDSIILNIIMNENN